MSLLLCNFIHPLASPLLFPGISFGICSHTLFLSFPRYLRPRFEIFKTTGKDLIGIFSFTFLYSREGDKVFWTEMSGRGPQN
jgi:hypothetical protein